jgi:hypothetical protein
MFLIGGPAFSGTTLLTFLLNQNEFICLDEPDFHNPEQSHRGIPFLARLFPDKVFPQPPTQPLSHSEAVGLIQECELVLGSYNLGMKTVDWTFMKYAKVYRQLGHPVIVIIRDIRDALVRPLPEWITEAGLNERYRLIWNNLKKFDLWVRYEELVMDPEKTMQKVSRLLAHQFTALQQWDPKSVPAEMLKLDRHALLNSGKISKDRVGIWKTSGIAFSEETYATARMMGY